MSGGILTLGNSLALQDSTLDTSGSGTLSFGSLIAATLGGLTGSGTLSLSNNTSRAVAINVGSNNASTAFSGTLNGPGSLTKIGNGTLLLTGSNRYTGRTTVNQGELLVDGSLASPVTVNSGGMLGGSGSLTIATVASGGSLSPGSPLGALTVSGSLVLSAGALLEIDLNALRPLA